MVINHLNIQKIKQLFTFCVTENQQFFGRKGKFLTKKRANFAIDSHYYLIIILKDCPIFPEDLRNLRRCSRSAILQQ